MEQLVQVTFGDHFEKGYEAKKLEIIKETPKMYYIKGGFYNQVRKADLKRVNYHVAYCFEDEVENLVKERFKDQINTYKVKKAEAIKQISNNEKYLMMME